MVTPLRKAASYEPRIAILGIWSDTWLTRGKYALYVAVRGSYGALTGSTWCLLPRKNSPIYCRVSYVAVTRIPSNTWHYVIIRYSYGELPKFVLRCSYEAALRKGVTTALRGSYGTGFYVSVWPWGSYRIQSGENIQLSPCVLKGTKTYLSSYFNYKVSDNWEHPVKVLTKSGKEQRS